MYQKVYDNVQPAVEKECLLKQIEIGISPPKLGIVYCSLEIFKYMYVHDTIRKVKSINI